MNFEFQISGRYFKGHAAGKCCAKAMHKEIIEEMQAHMLDLCAELLQRKVQAESEKRQMYK